MSTTPRTDAAVQLSVAPGHNIVCPNFARQLERENAKLLAANAELITLGAELSATADELRAENAELRAELDASCNSEELRQVRKELARTVSAMAELSGENAELRKDKARLDWLDSCGDVCSDLTGKYNWKEWLVSTINSSMKLDASIRSAIDSEMKLTKEENEN
jgi:ribosomal protein L29